MAPESIRDTQTFRKVYSNGKSYANRYLVMYILENGTDHIRKGISVSKKVGNSVVRHRLTRLIRESIRINQERVLEGYDIVIIARASAKGRKYSDIESAFLHLCRLHHILKKSDVK
jgi:ribonuclease P protein component